jgi:farnesyl-diphosphate farnesyltransferase
MREMCEAGGAVQEKAMWVQSGMVLDALRHATDALDYLRVLKNQSIFNFCAIPASMALATLALCFMNPAMFQRSIKIRKAEAASVRCALMVFFLCSAVLLRPITSFVCVCGGGIQLIMRSTNPRDVAYIFRDFSRQIHAKSVPADPNFLRISVACGKVRVMPFSPSSKLSTYYYPTPPTPTQIEQWCEHHYPSFVRVHISLSSSLQHLLSPHDVRTRVFYLEQARDAELARKKRAGELRRGREAAVQRQQEEKMPREVLMYIIAAFFVVFVFCVGSVYLILAVVGPERRDEL